MRQRTLLLAVLLLALLGAMAAKSLLVQLPPVRTQAAASQFDANRAAARLATLLSDERPHPADSAANDAVRERLLAELRSMGLDPQVRDQIACNELYKQRGVSCARVRNVVATIGPATGKHLLLSAHYDSSVAGPGAGDAGVGVASLLEVAAILRGRRLGRPVTFLFNEGEELGLVGARAFLADPLSRDVDSLINLEARGVTGPANMFETSRPNAPAVAAFDRAVDHPVANSLSTDVYRLMPNYTDVNTFAERQWLTLNLAISGNETRYHSAGDNLAALDRRSLQHMGDQALALTEELSRGVPDARGEKIFMDVMGTRLITLPMAVGLTLLELLLLAFAWIAWRRRSLGRGLTTMTAGLVLAAALAWIGMALLGLIRPGMFWRAYPLWTHLAVYATAAAAGLTVLRTIGAPLDARRLRPAFWLLFLLLGAVLAVIAPGGSIYFIFPPLAALAGMVAKRWWGGAEQTGSVAAIVILYLTFGEMLSLLEELLNQGPMWIFAPLGALLLFPVLIEAQALIAGVKRRIAIGMGALLALAGWIAAGAAPAYSADRQQQFTIEHVADAATGRARWSILNDFAPLPPGYESAGKWTLAKLPYSDRKRWLADAPRIDGLEPPEIRLVGKAAIPGGRRVTVRLQPNGAESIALIGPEDAKIRAAGIGAFVRPVGRGANDGRYVLRCFGRSCDGLTMDIEIARSDAVEFILLGSRPGLPPSAAPLVAARPQFARPQYSPDATIAIGRIRL